MCKISAKTKSGYWYYGLLFPFLLATNGVQATNKWEKIKRPIKNAEVVSVGNFTGGCVIGAEGLYSDGLGYQVIRRNRNRYYGHPNLVGFIKRLGKKVKAEGLPTLLIGDMSMPAGGGAVR